ncbi:hypothetical protein ACFZBU_43785 [Embleya sp. NPDC008237]
MVGRSTRLKSHAAARMEYVMPVEQVVVWLMPAARVEWTQRAG